MFKKIVADWLMGNIGPGVIIEVDNVRSVEAITSGDQLNKSP